MKYIMSITASVLALSAFTFAAASARRSRKARRKPTMTFRELLRDNATANFLFSTEKEKGGCDNETA